MLTITITHTHAQPPLLPRPANKGRSAVPLGLVMEGVIMMDAICS